MRISAIAWICILGCSASTSSSKSDVKPRVAAEINVRPEPSLNIAEISILDNTPSEVSVGQGPDVLVEMRLEEGGRVRHTPTMALSYGQPGKATVENPGSSESFGITVTRIGDQHEFRARYERNGKPLMEPSAAFGVREVGTLTVEDKAAGRVLTIKVQPVLSATRLTYNFRDKDIKVVIDMISSDTGFKIVVSEGLKGSITVSIHDVPWPDALHAIVKTLGYKAVWDEPGTVKIVRANEPKNEEK